MHSIRTRLALWYAAALAVGLALFAAAIWVSTWQSLRTEVERLLQGEHQHLAQFIRDQLTDARVNLRDEVVEFAQALPDGIAMEARTPRGVLIYSSAATFPWEQIRGVQHGPSDTVQWQGERYRFLQSAIRVEDLRFDVTFAVSLGRMDQTLNRLLGLMVALIPAVVLISCSGGVWLSRRALRPVDEMTRAAKTIGIEDLSRRLEVPKTGDELERLSQTWNEMLARLEDAFTRLSRFTADASHELRTPLAVIRSTAEIAGRRSRSEEAYRSALQSIASESERMTSLIEDLLFLARCDANNLDLPMGPVALDEVLRDASLVLSPAAAARRIELRIASDGAATRIWGNGAAIRRLVLILGDNAIKYSQEGGCVHFVTELRGDQVHLRVQDQGIGIAPSELPFVFQRFYRGANAREGGNDGFGLGLALASGIAERHRSSVRLTSSPEQGSSFEVAFPRSPG
ncbi:MAG: sensor histidine kinase [Bryobacteraceae bacterium]